MTLSISLDTLIDMLEILPEPLGKRELLVLKLCEFLQKEAKKGRTYVDSLELLHIIQDNYFGQENAHIRTRES